MGFLSWVSGAKQADKALEIADKATSGIVNGIDKLFFTEEEKSDVSKGINRVTGG